MDIIKVKNELDLIERTKFGISVPMLRKFAKKLAFNNYKEFVESNDFSTFELKLLHAFVLGYSKYEINIVINDFEKFVPYVDHWAVNDALCQNFFAARKYPEIIWDFVYELSFSKKEFESRIVSVMLLSHYLNELYADRVLNVLDRLNTDDYYSMMGVAWAFATYAAKFPQKTLCYLQSKDCHLDKKTYNKTLQKMRESFRISEDMKLLIKSMIKK